MAKATEAVKLERITMPVEVVSEVSQKIQEKSVVASLVPSEPETFTQTEYVTFTEDPAGEFVGEGAAKSSSTFDTKPQEAKLHKFQVTVRMSDEVTWADADNRLMILDRLFDKMAIAKAEGLDYGLLHAINPLTREVLSSLSDEALAVNAQQVTATGKPQEDLDNLPAGIIDNYDINGIALDRQYAFALRNLRNDLTGARLYPEIGLSLDPGSVDGIRAVTSGSVAARKYAPAPTGIQAILGNWGLVKWGFARDFDIELIEYGDPDGLGDLKRYNQVAYRAECVYGWRVLDFDGFAILKAGEAKAARSKSE